MTYEELMKTVRASEPADWLHNDEMGIFTYRNDLDIRIERRDDEESHRRDFQEEWANQHPDPSASKVYYDVYYRDSWVRSFVLISVDGGRADLPLPDVRTKSIAVEDYQLARAVDFLGTLDDYIKRSGLVVTDEGNASTKATSGVRAQ